MWIYGFAVVAVICITCREAQSLELEQFLSSLSSKKDGIDSDEVQEPSQVSDAELLQLVKRSGLIAQPQPKDSNANEAIDNQKLLQMLQTLQSMNRQQNLMVYSPEYVPASSLTTAQQRSPRAINAAPSVQGTMPYSYQKTTSNEVTSTGLSQDQLNNLAALQSQQRSQHRYSPQYIDSSALAAAQKQTSQASTAKQTAVDANTKLAYFNNQQAVSRDQQGSTSDSDKPIVKDDRQGHYAYDGYSGHDSGYTHARNPGYAHEPQYAHHEPEPYKKHINLPIPQLAIKFDPLGLLKLLLSGLPRPLFNLNGKIFLGLELGKGVGLGIGAAPAHHGGGKNLITIG